MKSRLRVLQVVCSDGFYGVERYVTTLSSALAQHGCDVTVLGGDGRRMQPYLAGTGARWIGTKSVWATALRVLQHGRADVIHAHMTEAELASVVGSSLLRTPVVTTRHFAQRRGSSRAARTVGRVLTTRLAAQLAISQYVAEATEGDSVIVTPGTPSLPDREVSPERDRNVLVAQRLEAEKHTDLAIHAWISSGLAARGWKLTIAGDGRERRRLEGLADRLGVAESCEFIGARSDISTLQRRAAIFLAPRPDEPLGLSVMEAMAAGTPVVAAAGGGHLETVGRTEGAALYPPFDTAEAGRLLAQLAADRDLRQSYGAALRQTHDQHFSVEQQVAKTLEVYRSVTR